MFALYPLNEYVDFNGVPLAAGKLYVYLAGRTQLAEIYEDINGLYPAANPVVLDNLGMCNIYLSNAHNYVVVCTDVYGQELFSRDIYPGEGGGGAGGRLYEGIDPIVVNNDKYLISAKQAHLGVQEPLYFVEDSETATIIGVSENFMDDRYVLKTDVEFSNDKVTGISGKEILAPSALSAQFVSDGWEYSNSYITGYSGSAFSAVTNELDVSASANATAYKDGNTTWISGKDWNNEITAASANALSEAINQITAVELANSALTANYSLSSNSATYDSDGNKITETYLSAITQADVPPLPYVENTALEESNGLISGISGSGFYASNIVDYSAGDNIDITNHVISGKDWSDEITAASANALSEAINQITAVDSAKSANISNTALTANYLAEGWEYSDNKITGYSGSAFSAGSDYNVVAGSNINVATAGTTFTVSGKDWLNTITGASSYAYNQAVNNITAVRSALSATYDSDGNKITETYLSSHQDVSDLPYVKNSSLEYSPGGHLVSSISGDGLYAASADGAFTAETANFAYFAKTAEYVESGWEISNNKITGYSGTAFNVGTNTNVVAGSNINVATAGDTFTVSGKDWQNTITAASSYAYNQATAKDKTYDVTAGEYSNIVVTTAGNTFGLSGRDWIPTIASYTSYVYSQATANASGKYIPYTNITTGDSGTTVYNVASGIRVTSNSGWTEIYNKNKENENEAHLQVAQNYSDGKSFWGELDGAGGGFIQLNWNSATIAPNSHSSYSNETTASLNIGKSHIHYYEGEQVDGHIPPVWSIEPGLIKLYDYNNYGASANYSYEGFEIHPNPGAMYKAYYEVNTHKFRIKGAYGANASGVIDVTPGYINFYDPDYNFISNYSNYGFHVKQNDHSYFETNHDDNTNYTCFRIRGDMGNTTGTLDLTPGFIQFYDSAWNVAAYLGPYEINQLKALLNHVQSASASWVNPSTATGSI